jgi:proteasome accessory factor A
MREGRMQRLVTEEQIKDAIFHPPETTRAFFRGRAVARFNRDIASIQWDELTFQHNGARRTVSLPHPAHDAALTRLNDAIREAPTYAEFEAALGLG